MFRNFLLKTCILGAIAAAPVPLGAQSSTGSATIRHLSFSDGSDAISSQFQGELRPKLTFPVGESGSVTLEALATARTRNNREKTFDFQRAKLDFALGQVDVTLGNDIVFMGVTEGAQLLDIINQRDLDVDFTGDTKLGQLMLRFGASIGGGRGEVFILENFRHRRFRDPADRLSGAPLIRTDQATRIGSPEDIGLALRYTRTFGDFDLEFVGFKGINRTPTFVPISATELSPIYSDTEQFGMSAQWTRNNWIGKFEILTSSEAPTRDATFETETIAVLGAEIAQYSAFGSPADLTYVAELSQSSLGQRSMSDYQNDLLLGLRAQFNDFSNTTLTASVIHDLDTRSNRLEVKFNRQLSESAALEMTYYNFSDVDADDVEFGFKDDSVFQIALTGFF